MRTNILGVGIDTLTYCEVMEKIAIIISRNKRDCRMVVTPNPEMVMKARTDLEFSEVLEQSELVVPDGTGVLLASKLNKVKIKERVRGVDLCYSIFDFIKDKGYSVYFLGAKEGVAEIAKKNMEEMFPGINICGVRNGYFGEESNRDIINEINELKPDILIVGLGFPRQEKWIYKYRRILKVNIAMAVGGSIDVMAGTVKRAPVFMQKIGLEWLYRLIKQPSRLGRMMILPQFVLAVLWNKVTFGKMAKK